MCHRRRCSADVLCQRVDLLLGHQHFEHFRHAVQLDRHGGRRWPPLTLARPSGSPAGGRRGRNSGQPGGRTTNMAIELM